MAVRAKKGMILIVMASGRGQLMAEMVSTRDSAEISRSTILERLARNNPRLVSLVAPAGFGKTTLALQIARSAGMHVVCDCSGIESDMELAVRVVAALANESTGDNVGSLIQCQLALQSPDVSIESRTSLVIDAWRNATRQAVFIFDNAEDLIGKRSAIRLLSRLLSALPHQRQIIVCSRAPLPLSLSRFAGDDRFEALTASDLAFTSSELQAVFSHNRTPQDLIDRAASVTRGWPIVTMLLASAARDGRLDTVLDELDDVAFDDLHDYLADEVLSGLDEAFVDALMVCAFVPSAKLADIAMRVPNGDSLEAFVRFARSSPLIVATDDTFQLHPLIRATILVRYADRRSEVLRGLAAAAQLAGNEFRAAELHLLMGDVETAASILDGTAWIERPSPSRDAVRLLGAFDRSVLRRYPRLWALTVLYGRFSLDPHLAVGEAQALLHGMTPQTPLAVRGAVVRPLAGFLSRLGMHDLGYRLIRGFEEETNIPPVPESFDQAAAIYIRTMIAGRLGRLSEFQEQFARAWPYASKSDTMSTLVLTERAAEVERPLGQRESERTTLEQALARARSARVPVNVGFALAEAAFGAWLAGEDEEYQRLLDALEDDVERNGISAFRYFVDCARGRFDRDPSGTELPKWVLCAHLIACSSAADSAERARRALLAHDTAAQYQAPFMQTLAALALGQAVQTRRRESFEQALRFAQRVESAALADAVAAFASGETDCGMLTGFAARLRGSTMPARPLEVDVFTGHVRRGPEAIELSDRRLELVMALARQRRPTPRLELQELLWPERDEQEAQNAFNVCLHHVRQQLGEGIVRTADGLSLAPGTRVDLWEVENFFGAVRGRRRLGDLERTTLLRLHRRLCAVRPARMERWAWFEPTARRIDELRCEAAQLLACEAFAASRPLEALGFAQDIIAFDPCDEPARELAIRAYFAAGEPAAARREYRKYAEVLARELQAEPSFTLEEMAPSSR